MPQSNLLNIQQAAKWASDYLQKDITSNNISYLIQYGKVQKHAIEGTTCINVDDLKTYYTSRHHNRVESWKNHLGSDLNWALSFDNYREKDTTKHVHRLHPYKGKFIPQLVEYFLDHHTDEFKINIFFHEGDIILDPFLGSGTTIIQANELGQHAIGIDVSQFNCLISECKVRTYDISYVQNALNKIQAKLAEFEIDNNIKIFDAELSSALAEFNNQYFPSPKFKFELSRGEKQLPYCYEKEKEFLATYNQLVEKYNIELNHRASNRFLDTWYVTNIRKEMDFVFDLIKQEPDVKTKKLLAIILSRTIRSCRATTHSDLATLKEAQLTTYYCHKHFKICKPLYSIKGMFNRYAYDTIARIQEYEKLKTDAHYSIIANDSRTIDILDYISKHNPTFSELLTKQKIKGIFTSPPYVGQIDYHEQHAYAYELLGYKRQDELEIGPLYKGQGIAAKQSYMNGISDVLNNCQKYMVDDPEIFLVANDKYNLYPEIAELSGLKIVNQYKRPVLNRTERDMSPYSEIIFHLKKV